MLEIPSDLPADLTPLAWLIGVWEGTGVIDYTAADATFSGEFHQQVSFSHDGGDYLNYQSTATVLGDEPTTLVAESGYWRLDRERGAEDAGPGLLPPRQEGSAPRTAEDVEELRTAEGDGFPLAASIVHADGLLELYVGQIRGPRIDLATDAVVRPAGVAPYSAATRMYGYVEGHLLWAWDIAALGGDLASHASARLAKAD